MFTWKKSNLICQHSPAPKHYLACQHDQALGLENNLVYTEQLGGTTSVLDAGHDVMLSESEMLAHGLMEFLTQR